MAKASNGTFRMNLTGIFSWSFFSGLVILARNEVGMMQVDVVGVIVSVGLPRSTLRPRSETAIEECATSLEDIVQAS